MPKETFFNLPEEKQEKIFREAIKEFSEKSYEKGNIGEIAKKAGVAKGSMYQYFQDKKELYIYCVKKSYEVSMKYTNADISNYENISIYDYFYEGFKESWPFLKAEKEVYIFLQELALGSRNTIKDEALHYILKAGETFMYKLIEKNKENGFIRSDIDTEMILLYLEGVSIKFKEKMLYMAKDKNNEIYDTTFEDYEELIKDMITLLKNGMSK